MLKPDASLGVGLATAGVVFGIYSQATPSIADIRVADQNDDHIASSDKTALWTSIVIVSGVSLLAKDPTIFILGGSMALVMSWWTKHANALNPITGTLSSIAPQQVDVLSSDEQGNAGMDMSDSVVGF